MLIAIILGSFLGTAAAWFLSTRLLEQLADRYTTTPVQRRFMKVMGGVLGAIAMAPAIFISVFLSSWLDREFDLPVGGGFWVLHALGLALVTALTVVGATGMGAALGVIGARSLYPGSRS
jgi:predicted phage tail protein